MKKTIFPCKYEELRDLLSEVMSYEKFHTRKQKVNFYWEMINFLEKRCPQTCNPLTVMWRNTTNRLFNDLVESTRQ